MTDFRGDALGGDHGKRDDDPIKKEGVVI